MNFLGNLVWLIMGGLLTALMYWTAGLIMCITIIGIPFIGLFLIAILDKMNVKGSVILGILGATVIGIPFGVQLLKIGSLSLWPFGHDLQPKADSATGCLQVAFNVLWILLGWWEIALTHLTFGLILCCTIVGIPWGLQHFKLALGSVFPFGKEVV